MSQGFIGLVPADIAIVISIMSIVIALSPPASELFRRLMITLVIFLPILAIIASKYTQRLVDSQKLRIVQSRFYLQNVLGNFLEDGERIQQDLAVAPITDLKRKEDRFLMWEQDVESFLSGYLGKAYVLRFQNCSDSMPVGLAAPGNVPDPLWTEQTRYWSTTRCRLHNLYQFSAQIAATE